MKSASPGRSPYLQGCLLQMRPACMFCCQVDLVWEIVMSLAYSKIIGPQHTCCSFHPRIGIYKELGCVQISQCHEGIWRVRLTMPQKCLDLGENGKIILHTRVHYYIKQEPIRWASGLPFAKERRYIFRSFYWMIRFTPLKTCHKISHGSRPLSIALGLLAGIGW